MSEINMKYYEIQDLLKSKELNLSLVSCFEEDNCYEIKIKKDNYIFYIITNLINYCYINKLDQNTNELNTNELNIDELNLEILYEKYNNINELNQEILYKKYYNNLELILNSIDKYNFNKKDKYKIEYNDYYHFYNKIDEKSKIFIDFNELNKEIKKNIIVNKTLVKIPNELLLNNNQLLKLIQNEIKNINSNYDYKHTIVPIDNNIFLLKATLYLSESIVVELKIVLDSNLYPFLPPKIELISPKVKLPLYFAIININVTKLCNWNSAISLEWILVNLANKLKPIINDYIEIDCEYNDIELLLLKLSNLTKEYYDKLCIDLELSKKNIITQTQNNNSYWKLGTGYGGSGSVNNWDINNYIKETEIKNIEIINCLSNICNKLTNENSNFIKDSVLLTYIINFTKGINMLQIEKDKLIFSEIIKILSNIKCYNNFCDIIDSIFINNLINNLKPINEEILLLFEMNEEFQNNELYQGIHGIYQMYYELKENIIIDNELLIDQNIENQYCNLMKPIQFGIQEVPSNHRFISEINKNPEPLALRRIISEISSFKSDLPLNYDSSIWIRIPKKNMNLFTFLISGPKDTPYENGLFEFHAFFPINYPLTEPKVLINTTGNNKVRFNPNLYHCGKVCLSLLGTWSGQESEKWNPKTSTFLQVLVSIQSLILVENPYFNEPGYEREMNTEKGKQSNKNYNNNLQVETIRWAINNQIKNPIPGYEEVIKNHFKMKKDSIINTVDKWFIDSEHKFKQGMEEVIKEMKLLLDGL
jgi:hypothetical protein